MITRDFIVECTVDFDSSGCLLCTQIWAYGPTAISPPKKIQPPQLVLWALKLRKYKWKFFFCGDAPVLIPSSSPVSSYTTVVVFPSDPLTRWTRRDRKVRAISRCWLLNMTFLATESSSVARGSCLVHLDCCSQCAIIADAVCTIPQGKLCYSLRLIQ